MTLTIGWPQAIMLFLIAADIILFAIKHGKPRSNYDVGAAFFNAVLIIWLLYWGGFFGQ